MKYSARIVQTLTICVLTALLASCASTETPRKRKPVPPSDDLSGLPWNRPRSFESNAGMGRAMPQSR
ncbi:MAG: hypothetical protein RL693_2290 [Verrucomicrobiota bacterium]|jgi:hypothetical protein